MATKYKFLNENAIFHPRERPYWAVLAFGVTLGSAWALFVVVMTLLGMNNLMTSFVQTISVYYPGYSQPLGAADLLLGLIYGFAHGFLFGLLVAYIYNVWRAPAPCGVELKKPNAITASEQPVIISPGVKAGGTKPPYTIAIIANPVLQSELDNSLRPDPILGQPKLFQAKVACILGSLASNPMIKEKFLEKMRIITLFDPSLANQPLDKKNALCKECAFNTIIEPIQRVYEKVGTGGTPFVEGQPFEYTVDEERLKNFLAHTPHLQALDVPEVIDLVFAVTASETHTRSTALFTFDDESRGGPEFTFENLSREFKRHHAPFAEVPGMVAYSAWDNRLKTPLHEFAHAMSSTTNGLIHDEYYDEIPEEFRGMPIINKQHATASLDENGNGLIEMNELPDDFARYADAATTPSNIPTDKARNKPMNWISFVPARHDPQLPCTMDISGDENRFDLCIEQFMSNRLEAKINRTEI
ncbi:MAG: hypothetical protein ACE5HO_14885 [bacterium]